MPLFFQPIISVRLMKREASQAPLPTAMTLFGKCLTRHGGNPRFLTFWLENQLAIQRDYKVVLFENDEPWKNNDPDREEEIKSLTKATLDSHAGESETSNMLYLHPDLVDLEAINSESGATQNRLDIPYGATGNGFNWVADYPI